MRHALTLVIAAAAVAAVSIAAVVKVNGSTHGEEHVTPTKPAPTSSAKKWDIPAELKKLVPGNDKIVGWKLDGEPTVVEASKLFASGWDRAAQFRPYGLSYRMSASFVPTSPGKPPFHLDVYYLESPIASFGAYATTRTTQSNFVKVGNQGIQEGNSIRFWKGPLYAEIGASGDAALPKNFLDTVAKDVASRMVMNSRVPELLGLMPGRGLVSNSQAFAAFDGFGPTAPKLSLTAAYQLESVDFRVAATQAASPAEATAIFQSLRDAAQANGQFKEVTTPCGEAIFASAALADRVTFVVRQGPFLALVENVPSESFAADLLKDLSNQMTHALDQKELDDEERSQREAATKDVKGH